MLVKLAEIGDASCVVRIPRVTGRTILVSIIQVVEEFRAGDHNFHSAGDKLLIVLAQLRHVRAAEWSRLP